MIDVTSNKFKSLSANAKILLLTAIVIEKEIVYSRVFCEVIDLDYEIDEFLFIQILQEIESKKINYKLEKIAFKKPSKKECENFLLLLSNQLNKTLDLEQIKEFTNYFFNFYEKNNWMVGKMKMTDWKKQIIYAVNNWDFKFKKDKKPSNIIDEIGKAFGKI